MLYEAISKLHPNARADVDFRLRDNSDGNGPFIEHWDAAAIGAAMPTPAQIAAAFATYVPPTPGDRAASEIAGNSVLRALMKVLASRFGLTAQQMIDAIKAQAD